MSNKERLEEIERKYSEIKIIEVIEDVEIVAVDFKDLVYLIKKSFEQAERVQELEDIIYQDERQAVLEGMYEQKERYREALEYINEELELVLRSNKGLAEKMFYIENSKRKITEVLEG